MRTPLYIIVFVLAFLQIQAQTAKRYLTLEHFTNTRCSSCGINNPALFSLLDANPGEVHHLSIHSEVPYSNCVFYQHNTVDNNYRKDVYSVFSTPRTFANGTFNGSGSNMLSQGTIDNNATTTSPIRIAVSQQVASGMLDIQVTLRSYGPINNTALRLFVAITEREVAYNAPNGESLHHNVFRDMLPNNSGLVLSPPAIGQETTQNFSVPIHPDWQASEIYALVFIQDTITKEIINSGTPFDLIIDPTVVPEDCANAGNGSIDLLVSGGTPPYDYAWSTGAMSSSSIANLSTGIYTVTITDAADAQYVDSIFVGINSSLQTAMTNTPATNMNGTAKVTATGGTPPYAYLWSNGSTADTTLGLGVGYASVTVTDANLCSKEDSIYISAFMVEPTVYDVSCYGGENGAVKVTIVGGQPPFTYSWSVTGASDSIGNLIAGTYNLTVTDSNLNPYEGSFTVSQPDDLQITVNTTAAMGTANDGAIEAIVRGGTPPYNYSWNTGDDVANIDQLSSGLYSLTVTDGNLCQKTTTADVSELSTGIAGMEYNKDIKVYPNPFDNRLTIAFDQPTSQLTLSVHDMVGAELIRMEVSGQSQFQFDTQALLPGMYFVVVSTNRDTYVKRVIKN